MGRRGGFGYIAFVFLKEEELMMNEFSMIANSASPADKQMPNQYYMDLCRSMIRHETPLAQRCKLFLNESPAFINKCKQGQHGSKEFVDEHHR